MPGRWIQHLREIGETAWKLAAGSYPSFVYGRPIRNDQIPVFTFHDADPVVCEAFFRFLAENDYRTLTCDEVVEALRGRIVPPRSIQLTFDDGYGSNWSVLLPLLERFDLKATIFLVTSRMSPTPGTLPRLDETEAGSPEQQQVLARDYGTDRFLRWDEVRALAASGRVDLQSHTHHHTLVFSEPRLRGFVTPAFREACRQWTFEWPWLEDGGRRLSLDEVPLGTPLLTTSPRMQARRRVLPSETARRACVETIAGEDESFFGRPGWHRPLEAAYRGGLARQGHEQESLEEMQAAIREDLETSRALMEREVSGLRVRHLAWPWGIGSTAAIDAAREAGFLSSYWVEVDGRRIPAAGMDPFRLPRLTWDFLLTLPGKGRESVWQVIQNKFFRRWRVGTVYQTH
jgi:hypothetical protein